MPTPAEYIRDLVDLYGSVEREILERIAGLLGQGLDQPDWADRRLDEAGRLRRTVRRLAGRLAGTTLPARAVTEAAVRGAQTATAELGRAGRDGERAGPDPAAAARVAELADALRVVQLSALRAVDDVYRQVIARASAAAVDGSEGSRRDAAQRALWEFADRGVTGFTDRAGRRWDLTSYTEMATRSAVQRARLDSHVGQLAAGGVGLVQVSDSPRECHLCRPWEGKVLAIVGGAGDRVVEHATRDGEQVTVDVAATLAAARLAGLFHPSCTHTVRAYLPGVTKRPRNTENPQGDEARQRLRALERRVRKWRAREAAALDDTARARAKAGLRAAQEDLRAHVKTSGAKRQPHRERLGVAR